MKITVLGSGTSTGVPQVGCTCPVCTSTDPHDKRLRSRIPLAEVEPYVPFKVTGGAGQEVEVVPLRVIHGRLPILGFRIGKMAWITDMTEMPAETYACLEGLDCLFMNALRLTPHPTHQSLSPALEQVVRIRPRKAYFIHASHQLGMHAEVEATLPPHVRLAYDGLTVEIG